MNKKCISTNIIIILVGFLALLFITSNSYAYWASNILVSNTNNSNTIYLGEWQVETEHPVYNPIGETNPYIDPTPPGENITPEELPENIPVFNSANNNTYSVGTIVIHNNQLYIVTDSNIHGTPGDSGGPWTPYDSANNFIWNINNNYTANAVVVHNGVFFQGNKNPRGQNITTNAWRVKDYVYTWMSGKSYHNSPTGTIVKYNNLYYVWQWAGTDVPNQNSDGPWKRLSPTDSEIANNNVSQFTILPYNSAKTYSLNEYAYLMVNGEKQLYRVVNATNANTSEPGEMYNAWNRVDTTEWQWFNLYNDNSYVSRSFIINDEPIIAYFKAVPGGTYNQNEPGLAINTWNRVDTIYYKDTNTYQTNSIVLHDGVMYKAIQSITTKIIPGVTTNWQNYWIVI